MPSIPAYAEDFSVEWMNEILRPQLKDNYVRSCKARESDIPGQTAEIILIDVTYAKPDSGMPERMVAKVTSRDADVLNQVIANYDQYRRETSFYKEFPDCGIATPRCLYADHDAAKQTMVLLMADLAPALSPSWAITPDQVKLALSSLPGLHGKWWNDPALKSKDWMVQLDNKPFFQAAFGAAHAGGGVLDELYESPDLTKSVMAHLAENVDSVLDFFATRSHTFVHGDYHAKQMFFPVEEGGDFAVIDWQFPFVAPGPWDFARMLSMCMATDVRRVEEKALIENYLQGLKDQGVSDYGADDFAIDYKMGLMISQMIMVIAAADTDPAIFERECAALGVDWREVCFNRTQRAMDEWDVLSFVRSI
jgi:hypothetical protein